MMTEYRAEFFITCFVTEDLMIKKPVTYLHFKSINWFLTDKDLYFKRINRLKETFGDIFNAVRLALIAFSFIA